MAMRQDDAEQARRHGQLVAKAWADQAFKQRLVSQPAAVLKEHGLDVPAGAQVRVVENTDQVVHFVLPAKPPEGELSIEQLEQAAGGGASCCSSVLCCCCT